MDERGLSEYMAILASQNEWGRSGDHILRSYDCSAKRADCRKSVEKRG